MILSLPILIAAAVLYLFEFPLGALMCRYVSMKLLAAVNVILGGLGILALILIAVVGDIGCGNVSRYSDICLIFIPLYFYVPNLIIYFKMRKKRKRNGEITGKYVFKRNALMAAILTACHFPILYFYAGLFVFVYY